MAIYKNLAQLRILDLPGAVDPGASALMLQPEDVGFEDQKRDDEAMLKEAVQNRILSESFEASRGLIGSWNLCELMLRAYVDPVKWKGSDQLRSHLGIPILAENFYAILAVVQSTLFGGYRPFQIDPASGTPLDAALAQEALITSQLKRCGYKGGPAKQELRAIVYDGLLYGSGVGMMSWETKNFTVKKHRLKQADVQLPVGQDQSISVPQVNEDDVEAYDVPMEINHPVLEHVPIRRIRVAPDCRRGDIRTATWAGRLIYLNAYDLDELRDTEGFNIPSREELVKITTPQKMDATSANPMDTQGSYVANPIFQQTTTPMKAYPENYDDSTVDPLAKKFEVFEYWTKTRQVWVLEGQVVILNRIHDLRRLPFVSFAFREAPDSFYGYGLGFWLTDFQRIAQGICNAFFDDVNLNLMGTYTSPAGLNNTAQAQWIFPGKVFKADPGGKVEPMTRNAVFSQEPLGLIAQAKEWATTISGAGAGVQGAQTGRSGAMRTPEGVSLIQQGEATKTQDLIDQICELVFTPFIEFCIEQNGKMKPSQIRSMLSDQLGQAFKTTPLTVLNGDYKVNVSAGAKLAARQSINQSLGFIQSVLQSPGTPEMLSVQAMKFDFAQFVSVLFEATGMPYKENLIVPMNDEDKQRMQAAQQQPAHDIQKIQAKSQAKQQEQESQGEIRGMLQAQKTMMDKADAPYEHAPGM